MKKEKFEKFVMDVKLNLGVSQDRALAAIGRTALKLTEYERKKPITKSIKWGDIDLRNEKWFSTHLHIDPEKMGLLKPQVYTVPSKSDYDDMLKRLDAIMPENIKGENKMNDLEKVEIRKVNRGFIVNVGCEILVFEDRKEMYKAIDLYHRDPKSAKDIYLDSDI